MKFTAEHDALRRTTRQFIDSEINPFVAEWEAAGQFPIHDVFKKMGNLGLLGICKPEENGGLGLDYSYNLVVAEELGRINCGGCRWQWACKPIWQHLRLHDLVAKNCGMNF